MASLKQFRSRQLVIEIGIALILAVVARIAWDQVYLPSRPVAQVGAQTLNQRDYQELAAIDTVHQFVAIQNQINEIEALLGGQGANKEAPATSLFGQEYQEALQLRDAVIRDLKSLSGTRVNAGLVDRWIEQEIILQSAEREGLVVSDAEIDAALGKSMTAALKDEQGHDDEPEDEQAHETSSSTTDDPEAAPAADPAAVQTLLAETYRDLSRMLKNEYGVAVSFSEEAFASYARRSQRSKLLTERMEQQLVPDNQSLLSLQVYANYLLLTVTPTLTATNALTDPVTLDDPAFAEGKAKADELYRQIKAGADFVKLAQEHSANPDEIVDPGWSLPDTFWPQLREAVLSQPLGEVGLPVKTPSGWYLVKVLERQERPNRQQLVERRAERFRQWSEQQRLALIVKRY